MRKGLELPVNVLVVVAIAVVIVLGVLALYMGVVTPGQATIQQRAAWNQMCQIVVQQYCQTDNPTGYNTANSFGTTSQWSFMKLCFDVWGIDASHLPTGATNEWVACRMKCGCPS